MINNVTLVGRLTKDVELRTTSTGVSYAQFTLAVNRTFKNQNGEYEADFINCRAWRNRAEFISNYARKGTLVGVVGRIETGRYENNQGQMVYTTDVVCDTIQLLESRRSAEQNQQPMDAGMAAPFGQQSPSSSTFTNNQDTTNDFAPNSMQNNPLNQGMSDTIADDDLPF